MIINILKSTSQAENMIAGMISNKKLRPVVTELFIKGRKLNISIAYIAKCYFQIPKDVRINCAHFFVMKLPIHQILTLKTF